MTNRIPDHILRKIQKCLALSKSDNAGEAGVAIRQARALMDKYGITAEEAAVSEIIEKMSWRSRSPAVWYNDLIQIVINVFNVDCVYTNGFPVFVGTPGNAQIAVYVYESLLRQVVRDRRRFLHSLKADMFKIRRSKTEKTALADFYCENWIKAVYYTVCDLYKPKERAVIVYMKRYENLTCAQVISRLTKKTIRDPRFAEAALRGETDGKNAQVFIGVGKRDDAQVIKGV